MSNFFFLDYVKFMRSPQLLVLIPNKCPLYLKLKKPEK